MRTTQIVEALLFASDAPLTAADLARGDETLDEDQVEAAVQELRSEYESQERAYQIYELGGGYQILTRPEFAPYLERFDTVPQSSRLSGPALEVLAVIVYRQPIGRSEIEEIRGVGSSGVLRTLLDRGLIEVAGRGEGLGRPLLYGTTSRFLEHFGFRSLEDLPRPEELPVVLRERPDEEAASDEAVTVASPSGEPAPPPDEAGGEAAPDAPAAEHGTAGSGNGRTAASERSQPGAAVDAPDATDGPAPSQAVDAPGTAGAREPRD